jgi:acyl-CoA synthetase (AMP-forming)/AMP-acid ligase II
LDNRVNLAEGLIRSAANSSQKGVFLIKGESDEKFISYRHIYLKALMVLYNLQTHGLKTGDELILQIKDTDNELFIYTFWACILGKIIPVPVSITHRENTSKVLKIFSQLKNPKIIIDEKCLEVLEKFAKGTNFSGILEELKENSISMDRVIEDEGIGTVEIIKEDDIAFIQFSSGSTGDPKGVVLTHKNLLTNIGDIIEGFNGNERDSMYSWMPLTHDMGMIGLHLLPLVFNINQYLMPTSLFIKNPVLWIKKINEHRVTLTASSNFGFRYFLDHLKDREYPEWDLSCIRKVFNGAEPISVDIINEFLYKLDRYNLKRDTMYTVYGMADASLAVAFPPSDEEFSCIYVRRDSLGVGQDVVELKKGEDLHHSMQLVVEGYSVRHCNMRIVDDNFNILEEGKLGNIQISGDNVTKEYYNNPELTKRIISKDGWLITGDLGFIKDGRIVVIGRSKDVICIDGITYYPHYIEKKCEEIEGIVSGRIVACGLGDEVIIFLLFKKKLEHFIGFAQRVKEVIREQINIDVDAVIPVRSIPKTTSGKVQRFKLIEMYEKGEFREAINNISLVINRKTMDKIAATED